VVATGFDAVCPGGIAPLCCFGMRPEDVPLAREIGDRMRVTRQGVFGRDSSQTDFARLMPPTAQWDISRWECGERIPSVVEFVRFAKACGVAPEKILAGVAPPRAEQMHLISLEGISPPTAKVVRRLVDILRERSRRTPTPIGGRKAS
jgi:hypothetical protein